MKEHLSTNPWLQIWVHPRQTMQEILNYDVKYRFVLLSGIYGFPLVLSFAQSLSLGRSMSLSIIFLISLVLAVFIGMLGITISSAILYWIGKWIGGQGSYLEVRSAVAWSNVPNAIQIVLWLVLLAGFGNKVFDQDFTNTPFVGGDLGFVVCLFLAQAALGIWSFVILLHTLGAAQQFSAWKSLLNIFIPIALLIVGMWFVSLFVF